MEAGGSSEMLVIIYQTARCHITDDGNFYNFRCERLKSRRIPWRWRQEVSPKRWQLFTLLQSVISWKNSMAICPQQFTKQYLTWSNKLFSWTPRLVSITHSLDNFHVRNWRTKSSAYDDTPLPRFPVSLFLSQAWKSEMDLLKFIHSTTQDTSYQMQATLQRSPMYLDKAWSQVFI
jgi:hypothetical protein